MKLEQLREIIREEAKKVVREEIKKLLPPAGNTSPTPSIEEHLNSLPKQVNTYSNPIEGILQEIRQQANQGRTGLENFTNINSNKRPSTASGIAFNMGMNETQGMHPGLDISQFTWAKKAGDVYKKSIEKDKEKYGVS
jgi:hypothetical protein